MAQHTLHIDALDNIPVSDRASLEHGSVIACLLTTDTYDSVWMRLGKVLEVSDDGTLVIYHDEATTAAGTNDWLVKSDWIARWPQGDVPTKSVP